MPKASCEACQKITSRIELDVARKSLHIPRAMNGYPSRRKKKYPISQRVIVEHQNGKKSKRDIDLDSCPIQHHVPFVRLASPEQAESSDLRTFLSLEMVIRVENEKYVEKLRRRFPFARRFTISDAFVPLSFFRLLWKISAGYLWLHHKEAYLHSKCRTRILYDHDIYFERTYMPPEIYVYDIFSSPRPKNTTADASSGARTYLSADATWVYCEISMLQPLGFPIYTCRIPNR